VRRGDTTISCRAFALIALLIAVSTGVAAADRPPPPKLPLAQGWTVPLDGAVGTAPAADASRIFVALKSSTLTARAAADGHELWRITKDVAAPMIVSGDLLIVAAGGAIEGLQAGTGRSAWVLPRVIPVAPLVADADLLYAVTEQEVLAVRATTGAVRWRRAAGGVRLAPALDGDRVYLGADDGRVLALDAATGNVLWEAFVSGGVSALAAEHGRVYAGGGDKRVHCLDGGKKGRELWGSGFPLGAPAIGHIAVDDERVYVAALDNVVRALDRGNGNQRWKQELRQRPVFGAYLAGHVVFVPAIAPQIAMLYDRNGLPSGNLDLPGDTLPDARPAIVETPDGAVVFSVTGSVSNEWNLSKHAPAGDTVLFPFAKLDPLPGAPYLTDPVLTPIGNVMQTLLLGDPLLQPFADVGWPIVLRDPPLVPLTVLPGLQLRPLSPVLPVRPAGRGPGG
jgi:outer membrane protein assembly factor BamB